MSKVIQIFHERFLGIGEVGGESKLGKKEKNIKRGFL